MDLELFDSACSQIVQKCHETDVPEECRVLWEVRGQEISFDNLGKVPLPSVSYQDKTVYNSNCFILIALIILLVGCSLL